MGDVRLAEKRTKADKAQRQAEQLDEKAERLNPTTISVQETGKKAPEEFSFRLNAIQSIANLHPRRVASSGLDLGESISVFAITSLIPLIPF
jgi:hypothetical protein